MDAKDILSILFGCVALFGLIGGIATRIKTGKGIGSQFIRFTALVVALPLAGALVFQGMMTEAIVSLILGIFGYVFPSAGKEG